MTRADEYHNIGTAIAKRGNPKELAAWIAGFFERCGPQEWHILSACAREHHITLRVRHFHPQGELVYVTWDRGRNRWHTSVHGFLSDALLAEWLGVPIPYLLGFCDALELFPDTVLLDSQFCGDHLEKLFGAREELEDARERALREQIKAAESRRKYLEKRRNFSEGDLCNRAAARARRAERKRWVAEVRTLRAALKEKIGQYDLHGEIPPILSAVHGARPLHLGVGIVSGVYFLVDKEANAVVYIGQSTNIAARVGAHFSDRVGFDWVGYLPVERDLLLEVERKWIDHFLPIHNHDSATWKARRERASV